MIQRFRLSRASQVPALVRDDAGDLFGRARIDDGCAPRSASARRRRRAPPSATRTESQTRGDRRHGSRRSGPMRAATRVRRRRSATGFAPRRQSTRRSGSDAITRDDFKKGPDFFAAARWLEDRKCRRDHEQRDRRGRDAWHEPQLQQAPRARDGRQVRRRDGASAPDDRDERRDREIEQAVRQQRRPSTINAVRLISTRVPSIHHAGP